MSAEDVRLVRETLNTLHRNTPGPWPVLDERYADAQAALDRLAETKRERLVTEIDTATEAEFWKFRAEAAETRLARLERIEEAARRFVTRYRMPGAPPSWGDELAALEDALAATEEGAERAYTAEEIAEARGYATGLGFITEEGAEE